MTVSALTSATAPGTAPPPAPAPQPIVFDSAGGWCVGWYHAPAAPARGLAVVLCPPAGYEAICSYPTYVQLARSLAAAGFPVLRFDYPGTGDSAGDEREPGQVANWLASIEAAVEQARRRSGAAGIALFGLRLGGTLAVTAAARLGGVEGLVLWAPCATGKAFARELRASGTEVGGGELLAFGHAYTAELLQDLQGLDAMHPASRPAPDVLVVARDDLPAEGPLPGSLRSAGCNVQLEHWPGYAAMVGEPRSGVLDSAALEALQAWLRALPAAAQRPLLDSRVSDAVLPARFVGAVREETWLLGPERTLCGMFAEPATLSSDERRTDIGIVLLNVGGNHRVGPHRFYVTAARAMVAAGYRVLRLDIAGIGDSAPQPGKPWANLYDEDSAADVRAAIDALAARGCRQFILMGICSGSYLSFQSAMADPRVDAVVLMNSRLLEWTPGHSDDDWQDSMQQYAKSTDWYRRALLRSETWLRLVRGELDLRLVTGRFLALAKARLRRMLAVATSRRDTLHAKMKRLCRRGTDVLMVVSDADDARDYMEFHFGRSGSRMRAHPNFRMLYVPEADHTFSRPGNQAFVIPSLLEYLATLPRREKPGVTVADPPSTGADTAGVRARPTH
jgi:alpha-beta hydrolase superfamily lysophospholipase